MSPPLEIEGKNVDQAVQKACQRLNIPRQKLRYDVLSYGSTGIFGLGRSRNARIRVRTSGQTAPASGSGAKEAASGERSSTDSDIEAAVPFDTQTLPDESVNPFDGDGPVGMGRDVLTRIVDAITDNARVTVAQQSERVVFRVEGGNAAILIGKHGQTLEAIQSLVEKVVNKQNSERIHLQVDVGGYRQNRKKRLIRNAERLAQKCKRSQKPVSAGLLNAYERRIVHIALKDHRSVYTRSTGDGLLRNLMILPSNTAATGRRKNEKGTIPPKNRQ